ncbi:sugar nucleotide-binding protein [Vibrio vulnificus]|nr:sugar nucleotide-binding protein [Vibrio vulnificus]EGQ9975059.1 sugar nucleotide-binding protein [Vibrio vulnificus]EHK9044004.1 sugar nucleotide-binding protein [Vibrio vulnificus]ELU2537063.1 sugar nucleotide-binding protein [Vibrio vulnificus]RZP72715.1 NAD-dependent epimerase/dehydratase family protein [Vibrio vulnificus]
MKKRVLLLGETGFIGSTVLHSLESKCEVLTIDNGFKITDKSIDEIIGSINEFVNYNRINTIVNCIAMANLDQCELEKDRCKLINTLFVVKLVDSIKDKKNIKLVHISTNAVYDGQNAPYSESCACEPVNFYGRCKLDADNYIEMNMHNYAIARPITVYGPKLKTQRDNPVSFIVKKITAKEELRLVDDNIVNMIHVDDLSSAICKLSMEDYKGIFNLSGDVSECRYDLGVRICRVMNVDLKGITKISGSSFKTEAKRAFNTSFNNDKMKSELGILPRNIDDAIDEIISKKAY